jgi:hypothetical protein
MSALLLPFESVAVDPCNTLFLLQVIPLFLGPPPTALFHEDHASMKEVS